MQLSERNRPLTTVSEDDEGLLTITRTADGVTWKLVHVGRCWRVYYPNGDTADIAGSANSERAVLNYVRRLLREDTPQVADLHCTGW